MKKIIIEELNKMNYRDKASNKRNRKPKQLQSRQDYETAKDLLVFM